MNAVPERLIQICVISCLLFFSGITPSCSQQQKGQVDLPTHTEGGGQATLADESSTPPPPPSFSDTDRPTTPKGFDYLKVNFYIGTTKVNFLEDSSDDIIRVIGKDKILSKVEGQVVNVDFPDLKIGYWQNPESARTRSDPVYGVHWKGNLRTVELTTPKYFVEGGGRVGDSLSEIMKKYPGCFFNANLAQQSGDRNPRYYEYKVMSADNSTGVGFDFVIDKNDKIVSIVIVDTPYEC